MALTLAIVLFLTVVLVVFSFGAAAYAPFSVLGSRLRALGWQRTETKEKPAFKERLEQALDPLSKALPLSPSEVSRARKWLIQAGYREQGRFRSAVDRGGGRNWLLHPSIFAQTQDPRPAATHHAGVAGCSRPHRHLRGSGTGARPGADAGRRRSASCPS